MDLIKRTIVKQTMKMANTFYRSIKYPVPLAYVNFTRDRLNRIWSIASISEAGASQTSLFRQGRFKNCFVIFVAGSLSPTLLLASHIHHIAILSRVPWSFAPSPSLSPPTSSFSPSSAFFGGGSVSVQASQKDAYSREDGL